MPVLDNWAGLLKAFDQQHDRKCAIVVQGGAMRAIYSMAALFSIEELGYGKSFDQAYGSSAGGINLAYMLAGQAKDGTEVFLNHISNWRFVSFCRPWKIVDIDFMVDTVVRKQKRLDIDKVRSSSTELHIYCTNISSGRAKDFTNRNNNVDMLEVIRATAAMPYFYHRTVELEGDMFVDGGVAEYLPLLRAIEDGCTDIAVVATKAPGSRRKGMGGPIRKIARLIGNKYSNEFINQMFNEDINYNHVCDIIEGIVPVECNIYPVFPSNSKYLVSRTNTDRDQLLQCAKMARNDIRAKFGFASVDDDPFEMARD